jgi:pyridoxine 5'-phosphate synthase PdxJ
MVKAQADQRPAKQLTSQRREQRRHRRKLDVAALEMQPGDGVVQLIPVPAVPSGASVPE